MVDKPYKPYFTAPASKAKGPKVSFVAEKNLMANSVRINMLLTSGPSEFDPLGQEIFAIAPPEFLWVKVENGEKLPDKPTFEFRRAEVEALMTELWDIGIRPKVSLVESQQDLNSPELVKALQNHIHDLKIQIDFLSGIIVETMQLKK